MPGGGQRFYINCPFRSSFISGISLYLKICIHIIIIAFPDGDYTVLIKAQL